MKFEYIYSNCQPFPGYPKSETQDPGPISEVELGTREAELYRWDLRLKTEDPCLKPGTQDPYQR